MKVAITGHSKGIGGSLYKRFIENEHTVFGYSRSNGFDIGSVESRANILEQSKDIDIFINNAYHPIGQTLLLKEALVRWKNTNTLIINISSKCVFYSTDNNNQLIQEYLITYKKAKQEQQDIIMSLLGDRQHRILNVLPGMVNTGMSLLIPSNNSKIDLEKLSELIYNIVSMRDYINIQEIIIDPPYENSNHRSF